MPTIPKPQWIVCARALPANPDLLQNPYKAPGYPSEKDRRTEEEKAKHVCRKSSTERARLLQEIFEAVEVRQETGLPFRHLERGANHNKVLRWFLVPKLLNAGCSKKLPVC